MRHNSVLLARGQSVALIDCGHLTRFRHRRAAHLGIVDWRWHRDATGCVAGLLGVGVDTAD